MLTICLLRAAVLRQSVGLSVIDSEGYLGLTKAVPKE